MKKIMVIEDDVTMRGLLKTLLELENFEVIIYGEAPFNDPNPVISLKNAKPEGIILDVHLRTPGGEIDGVDLMKQIRSDPELKGLRTVMASGMDLKEQCLEAGADSFLLKPYMPDALIEVFQK